MKWYENLLQKNIIPDFIIRRVIRKQLEQRLSEIKESGQVGQEKFVQELEESPIAICTRDANEQHYEVPPGFFHRILGKHLKYSCGYWPDHVETLDASEEAMLELYVERADLKDGQIILDLGCGWGSLSLYLAKKFPNSKITAVSNSRLQRLDIEEVAYKRGIENLLVLTEDMNRFESQEQYDRIVSIEMFEHMRGYEKLFDKISSWLKPDGKLFVHIFCHKEYAYPFMAENNRSWMARYFFAGGIMPSLNLFSSFAKKMAVKNQWQINGKHYQKTCEAWLDRMDDHRDKIYSIFKRSYGKEDAMKWWVYWRIFFMACAELFGYNDGEEWFVAHYLLQPTRHCEERSDEAISEIATARMDNASQ